MADNIPFTQLDFDQAKENLKTFLKAQSRFKDYDFDGSNINILLDVLSYNTFHNNLYENMVFSELFMDSVQLRENAVSHAKELNYLPSSHQSARSVVDLTINVPDPTNSSAVLTIPKGTKFNAQCGQKSYTFITDRNRSVKRVSNSYRITDLEVYEGRLLSEFYTVDDSNPVTYVINNEYVDTRSTRVFVRENSNPNSTKVEFTGTKDIFGIKIDDSVYYTEPHFDNLYKISFGRDKFGMEPVNGSVVEIEYRVTKGEEPNGAKSFTLISTIGGYTGTVNSATTATNGSDRETIEDIKFFAPKSIQIQERAVTKTDYEVLLKQRFPNIQTISVYGGDLADPPQYGKVIISVDAFGTEGAGASELLEYRNFLRDKTPLTIEPIFVPAQFVYVSLDVNVYYNPTLTTKSSDELEQIASDVIQTYSDTSLNMFDATLRQSRLTNLIDVSDISVLSTDVTSTPIIEYVPVIGTTANPTFDFTDSLVRPYLLNEVQGFTSHNPAITTTIFTLEGTAITLQDDGDGTIIAVTANSSSKRIFKQNVGTVDYQTGIVRLSNLVIDRYEGSAIQFKANTINKDIRSEKNKILVIRSSDVNINMVAVR